MKKNAVIFGAGQIGRGFIGDICFQDGYQLIYVDVDKELIKQLNREKSYPIWVLMKTKTEKLISGVSAIHFENVKDISRHICETNIVFTAVGANNLGKLGHLIAGGIKLRSEKNNLSPLNIVICENIVDGAKILFSSIAEALPKSLHAFLKRNVGLVETVVSRMVAPIAEESKAINPLLVRVEPYDILPVEKKAFKGQIPKIKAFHPVNDIYRYEELKRFVHNLSHATLAYAGYLKNYTFIWEAMNDSGITTLLDGVLKETNIALMKKHRFPKSEIEGYARNLKKRFRNKLLSDTIYRVARDPLRKLGHEERIIGAIKLCFEHNISPDNVYVVASYCLCYNYPDDPEAVKLQKYIHEKGVGFVLENVCKLKKNSRESMCILKNYAEIKSESSNSKRY